MSAGYRHQKPVSYSTFANCTGLTCSAHSVKRASDGTGVDLCGQIGVGTSESGRQWSDAPKPRHKSTVGSQIIEGNRM